MARLIESIARGLNWFVSILWNVSPPSISPILRNPPLQIQQLPKAQQLLLPIEQIHQKNHTINIENFILLIS